MEKYEVEARAAWNQLHMGEGLSSDIASAAWVHWLKAYQTAMKKFTGWTDQALSDAWVAAIDMYVQDSPNYEVWLKEYKQTHKPVQDKMYSRKDMIEAYNAGYQDSAINENYTPDEWLQQYEEQHKQQEK